MSIADELSEHVKGGKLYGVSPAVISPNEKSVRGVFVSKEVWDLIGDEANPDASLERVSGQARARLDSFTLGKALMFALSPRNKSALSDIARNAPIGTGIVDVRITNPEPKLRIFGGFGSFNLLILLTWKLRQDLDFDAEIARCRASWDLLFPSSPPMIGTTIDDYISKPYFAG